MASDDIKPQCRGKLTPGRLLAIALLLLAAGVETANGISHQATAEAVVEKPGGVSRPRPGDLLQSARFVPAVVPAEQEVASGLDIHRGSAPPPPVPPPVILSQSRERIGRAGRSAVLDVFVSGASPLAYRWLKEGVAIPGSTGSLYRIAALSPASAGTYQLIGSNAGGSVTSDVVRVSLGSSPEPFVQAVSSLDDGGALSFREALYNLNAMGGGTISMTNLSGAISVVHPLPAIEADIVVIGPGPGGLQIVGSAGKILSIAPEARLSIQGVSFSGAQAGAFGGAISNAGTLKLLSCWFERNGADLMGGAVYSTGELEAENCLFRSNRVSNTYAYGGAGGGGAISFRGPRLSLSNCLFVDNRVVGGDGSVTGSYPPDYPLVWPGGDAFGGALNIAATDAVVSHCSFSNNQAVGGLIGGGARGGAIYAESGHLWLSESIVASNAVQGQAGHSGLFGTTGGDALGGGVYWGIVTGEVTASSIFGNSALAGDGGVGSRGSGSMGWSRGGGMCADLGLVRLENVTFTGNRVTGANISMTYEYLTCGEESGARGIGGGLSVSNAVASLQNCTLSANLAIGGPGSGTNGCLHQDTRGAGAGGGIANDRGSVLLANTIIAGNTSAPVVRSPDLEGLFVSLGSNLIQNTNFATGFMAGDLIGVPAALDDLKDNGGPTPTMALLPDSVAIDRGSVDSAPPVDQRGVGRPLGFGVDMGAYEAPALARPSAPRVLGQDQAVVVSAGGTFTLRAAVAGTPPFTWSWEKDAVPLPLESSPWLTADHVSTHQSGLYRLRVSNAVGTVASSPIRVSVVLPDPITLWDSLAMDPFYREPIGMTYGAGQFVILGRDPVTIVTSTDGAAWITRFTDAPGSKGFASVAHYDGRFVAAGPGGILVSTNGTEWARVATAYTNDSCVVVGGSSGFLIRGGQSTPAGFVGQDTWLSKDLIHWSVLPFVGYSLGLMAFNSGVYVVGALDTVYVSPDAVTWSSVSIPPLDYPGALLPAGAGLALVGGKGYPGSVETFFYSEDGRSWRQTGSLALSNSYPAAVYGHGLYLTSDVVPATATVPSPNLRVYASKDTVNWTPVYSRPSFQSASMVGAYGNGRFVMFVGGTTGLLRSRNLEVPGIELHTAGQGSITVDKDPEQARYGESVTLTAVPGRYYRFVQWSDWVTNASRTEVLSSVNDFTAIFAPTTRLETLTYGGVSRTAPAGLPAVLANGQLVVSGSVSNLREVHVTLLTTLTNASLRWTLDGSAPRPGGVALRTELNLRRSARLRVAAFLSSDAAPLEADPVEISIQPAFTITLSTPGGGRVSVAPSANLYPEGSTAVLQGEPAAGWSFAEWVGDVAGSEPSIALTPSSDLQIQGIFAAPLLDTPPVGGALVKDPDLPRYPYGFPIRLTAIPSPGRAFIGWNTTPPTLTNPIVWSFTNSTGNPIPRFSGIPQGSFSFLCTVIGAGRILQDPPGGVFRSGTLVTLTAIPDPGQEFVSWSGAGQGVGATLQVTLDASRAVLATFTSRPYLQVRRLPGESETPTIELLVQGAPGTGYQVESRADAGWMPLMQLTNSLGFLRVVERVDTTPGLRQYRAVRGP